MFKNNKNFLNNPINSFINDLIFCDMNKNKQNNFESLRKKLRDELALKYPFSESVLSAFAKVERELFAGESNYDRAYEDIALPIEDSQTISQPYTVAYMPHHLDVSPKSKVLEVGTGSGYQSAILHSLGAEVFTIERIRNLFFKASNLFDNLGYNINVFLGDGSIGLEEFSPYDRIIVTAAAPSVPKALIAQLRVGGKMIIPVGDKNTQEMLLLIKGKANNQVEIVHLDTFRFVPLIGKEGW